MTGTSRREPRGCAAMRAGGWRAPPSTWCCRRWRWTAARRRAGAVARALPPRPGRRIAFLEAPVCDGCGAPLDYDTGRARAAPPAWPGRRAFDRARAACIYDEASRDLILKLKHADRTDLAGLFAAAGSPAPAATCSSDADARRARAAASAAPARRGASTRPPRSPGRSPAAPASPTCPARWSARRHTPSQGGKSGSGRRRNVAGAFAVPPRPPGRGSRASASCWSTTCSPPAPRPRPARGR